VLTCAECGCELKLETPWHSVRVDVPGEDETPQLAFYCAECAERVLGPLE
jgi:hypothetical protein